MESAYQTYRTRVATAVHPLDRFEEDKILQRVGQEDWAIKLRAWLLGHFHQMYMPIAQGPVDPNILFEVLEAAKNNGLFLDTFNLKEYLHLKGEARSPRKGVVLLGEEVT